MAKTGFSLEGPVDEHLKRTTGKGIPTNRTPAEQSEVTRVFGGMVAALLPDLQEIGIDATQVSLLPGEVWVTIRNVTEKQRNDLENLLRGKGIVRDDPDSPRAQIQAARKQQTA